MNLEKSDVERAFVEVAESFQKPLTLDDLNNSSAVIGQMEKMSRDMQMIISNVASLHITMDNVMNSLQMIASRLEVHDQAIREIMGIASVKSK